MTALRWEDPPPDRFRWRNAASELKEHPGRWARILEAGDKSQSTNAWVGLTKHGCEVAVRKVTGGFGVWARWPEDEMHYADHGVAGGFPHRASDCSGRTT